MSTADRKAVNDHVHDFKFSGYDQFHSGVIKFSWSSIYECKYKVSKF